MKPTVKHPDGGLRFSTEQQSPFDYPIWVHQLGNHLDAYICGCTSVDWISQSQGQKIKMLQKNDLKANCAIKQDGV